MKAGLIELVFIVDKSGSMQGLESDTIGGFNSMLEKQKVAGFAVLVTTILFDTNFNRLHHRVNINAVPLLTDKEYVAGGSTALLDAVGSEIDNLGKILAETDENERPEQVIFVIITDGEENSSRVYDYRRVKEMIEHQRDKYNWEFIYIGANIDAEFEGKRMGISGNRSINYVADKTGTDMLYDNLGRTMNRLIVNKDVRAMDDLKMHLEDDHSKRKGKKKKS